MSGYLIVEEEFLSIAEKFKPFTEEKMKIEPFPWFEGYLINMDELYTELTLEKVEMKLLGEERRRLGGYQEIFDCNQSNPNNKKVLMKADPGMGKTTLGQKMSWDWARGHFKKFSMIFFVALKLVKPGDPIEKVIMQQNPELEGLGVSQQKLKALLNRYSSKILIILDGLDEHGLGQNGDVLKMIRNQKLLGCPILISSRPHSTWEIEKYFPTIVRVEGFTEEEAKKFVSNFFTDENKIEQIMEFRPSDSREDFPVHKCPILLSILCFLVNKKEVDLSDTSITIGDMYFKMVKCLYKNYTIKKGIRYNGSDLIEVMTSVGQLALRTLLSHYPLLQRSEVLKIAGDFVLDYGFLAGHRDFTDPTADIYVTYVHRSIEEFFGSFGFLQALDDGKSVDDILVSDCKRPIFMVNPLVLRFCLWLLTQKCFDFRQNVYQKLVSFAANRFISRLLDTQVVEEMYPAMTISDPLLSKDSSKLKFLKHVFEKCEFLHVFVIRCGEHEMCNYGQAGKVLGLISSDLLSKLTCLSITGNHSAPSIHQDPLAISIDVTDSDTLHKYLNILLPKYNLLKRNLQVYARVKCCQPQDLSTLMTKHMKQLHFQGQTKATLFASDKFPHCLQLTHFTVQHCHIDESVPSTFKKAIQDGDLPHLKRVELIDCTVSDCEWPDISEISLETREKLDSPQMQRLLSKVTELTFKSDIHRAIPVHQENLSVLKLRCVESHNLPQKNDLLINEKLPNLLKLSISANYRSKIHKLLDKFEPHQAVKLEKLALQQFTISVEGLEILREKLTCIPLTELDLTHTRGFSGNFSVLFTHSFPTLNTLKLGNCRLNANDLQSLTRANVEGKLPQLRHLDISHNEYDKISDLFTYSAQWNQLTTLVTTDVNFLNVDPECLSSLEELILDPAWRSQFPSVTRQWPHLKVIVVDNESTARCITDGAERGMFPSLTTLKYRSYKHSGPLFKMLKANISVEHM